jgi:hypothetical protein
MPKHDVDTSLERPPYTHFLKNKMKIHWRRAIFLLLMIGLPLFAVAATSMSFCQTTQMEMVQVDAAEETSGNCAIPCSHAQNNFCESGHACGTCIPPLADVPRLSHSIFLLSAYPPPFSADHSSHITGLPERPPMVG